MLSVVDVGKSSVEGSESEENKKPCLKSWEEEKGESFREGKRGRGEETRVKTKMKSDQ